MKSVSFKTIGCRLNQAETAAIASRFKETGYEIVDWGSPCDVAVIHTCTITNNAERTCVRLARTMKKNGVPIVILAGCAIEDAGERLQSESGVDIIANQKDKFRLPEILNSRSALPAPCSPTPLFTSTRALVKVQDGCNFRCAYCIVPSVRGKPASRPLSTVVDEIKALADAGYKEVVLTGANLGCYRDGKNTLIDLLKSVEKTELIKRIRISSIESSTVEREIINYMAGSQKLCRFLHLPLQSGDDDILARMGRRYTSTEYRKTVEYAADRIPGIGIGTDIIIGLPGEDKKAFQNSYELVKSLPFSNLHVFSYSKRKGTRAADMKGQILKSEKKERTASMIELGNEKRSAFARNLIGKPVSVLIERFDENGAGRGWTEAYIDTRINHDNLQINQIVDFVPQKTIKRFSLA